MGNYIYEITLYENDLKDESVFLKELKYLINEEKEIDKQINTKFPISNFGNLDEEILIKGAKKLIDEFYRLYDEKYDLITKYKNIQYIGIEENKIMFRFKSANDIYAKGIYTFNSEFMEFFKLSKFASYCQDKRYDDLLKYNFDILLKREGETEKQFRLLKCHDSTWGIRGVTSTNYKNYDNSIALYLSILALQKYSKEKNVRFKVNFAYLSDSYLQIFFEQDTPIHLSDNEILYLGLAISNGEIRNYRFTSELRYRIVNTKNNATLTGIFNKPVYSIQHSMNINTIEENLNKLLNLKEQENIIIEFIKDIHSSKDLTEDLLYKLFRSFISKIDDCQDITKSTKDTYRTMLEAKIYTNNTMTILDFFDKLDLIDTDVEEKIFIERIVHKTLLDIMDNSN